jgi:hypothetical protein
MIAIDHPNNSSIAIGEEMKACVAANNSTLAATETSHQSSKIEPTAGAMRCRSRQGMSRQTSQE